VFSQARELVLSEVAGTSHTAFVFSYFAPIWSLSPRVFGMAMEWAALHQTELLENWDLARQQAPLKKIAPLE
jgi:hypothetical protein